MTRTRPELESFTVTCSRCGGKFLRDYRGGKWVAVNLDGTRHVCRKGSK